MHCRVAVVGAGAMAEAMLTGLLASRAVNASDIVFVHPRERRRQELTDRLGVVAVSTIRAAVDGSDVVLLAVKPQKLFSVLPELAEALAPAQLVLSVVSGASTGLLASGLGHSMVVRAMPNTPVASRDGITVWFRAPSVVGESLAVVRRLLEALGTSVEVDDERLLAAASAVSGSGPAYVLAFVEALVDAAVGLGLPRDMARHLALETVRGTASLALTTPRHLAELRDDVTSPGGSTAAALAALHMRGFHGAVGAAVVAAAQKAATVESGLEHDGARRPPWSDAQDRSHDAREPTPT